MFTGIITDVGRVTQLEAGDDCRLEIATSWDMGDVALGASIACNGICLTVIERAGNSFAVQASRETQDKTTLASWRVGQRINLERALRLGDELGGHLVSGHVDGVAIVTERQPVGDSLRFSLQAPDGLARFIAPKGSVALDGVSLTVNEVHGNEFTVNIIPHTLSWTNLGDWQAGHRVNIEIDMLARYVARLQEYA